jgi:hypothetical protein
MSPISDPVPSAVQVETPARGAVSSDVRDDVVAHYPLPPPETSLALTLCSGDVCRPDSHRDSGRLSLDRSAGADGAR